MMKRFYILLFTISLIACSNDDNGNVPLTSTIDGSWNLIKIQGGFIGVDYDFEKGVIIWNFDESKKTLTVTNNNTSSSITYDGLSTGVYTYTIIIVGGNKEIIVNNDTNLGSFSRTGSRFTLDEQFKDGYLITFER